MEVKKNPSQGRGLNKYGFLPYRLEKSNLPFGGVEVHPNGREDGRWTCCCSKTLPKRNSPLSSVMRFSSPNWFLKANPIPVPYLSVTQVINSSESVFIVSFFILGCSECFFKPNCWLANSCCEKEHEPGQNNWSVRARRRHEDKKNCPLQFWLKLTFV